MAFGSCCEFDHGAINDWTVSTEIHNVVNYDPASKAGKKKIYTLLMVSLPGVSTP